MITLHTVTSSHSSLLGRCKDSRQVHSSLACLEKERENDETSSCPAEMAVVVVVAVAVVAVVAVTQSLVDEPR